MKAILLALMFLVCAPPLLATPANESAAKTLTDAYAAAWNKHDGKAMAALWTEDGDFQSPVGQVARGRAEIEKLFLAEHTGRLKETKLGVKKLRVRSLMAGTLLVDVDLELTGGKLPDGKAAPAFPHQATFVAQENGKSWKVVAWRAFLIIGAIAPPK